MTILDLLEATTTEMIKKMEIWDSLPCSIHSRSLL